MSVSESTYNIQHDEARDLSIESDEVDSLPDTAESDSISSEDGEESDAEKEWKESLQQLELLLTMVVVPYAGRYFGRKFAYWGNSLSVLEEMGFTDSMYYRLGKIHGMELSCRRRYHQQSCVQGCGCHRSCSCFVNIIAGVGC